jgi:hypothetical protein
LIGILLPGVARPVGRWLATHLEFPQWAFALMFHLIPCLVLFYGLIWLGERLFLVYAANFAQFNEEKR